MLGLPTVAELLFGLGQLEAASDEVSIHEYETDRTKRNKISYPCTNNTNTNNQASTNEQNKFTTLLSNRFLEI